METSRHSLGRLTRDPWMWFAVRTVGGWRRRQQTLLLPISGNNARLPVYRAHFRVPDGPTANLNTRRQVGVIWTLDQTECAGFFVECQGGYNLIVLFRRICCK